MTAFFRRWRFQFLDDLAQMKKIGRDPILLAAILLCIVSLFLFVVFPL